MSKQIDFRTSGYFSGLMVFLGIALIVVGLVMLLSSRTTLGLIVLLVSVTILTTHSRLHIDFQNHEYHDYLWILGLKTGERGKFKTIEYLFIKRNKVSQRMNSMASSTTVHKEVYDGYLKFSEEVKIHLMTRDSRDFLIKELKVISSKLQTRIIDYTEREL